MVQYSNGRRSILDVFLVSIASFFRNRIRHVLEAIRHQSKYGTWYYVSWRYSKVPSLVRNLIRVSYYWMFNQEKLGKALSVRTIYLVDLLETQFSTQARNLSVYSILAFPHTYWYHSDTCSNLPLSKHCPFLV